MGRSNLFSFAMCPLTVCTKTSYTVVMSIAQQIQSANRTHLARQLGLSRVHVVQVLNGKQQPSLSVAAAIAKRLGVSLDALHDHIQRTAATVH